MTPRWFRMRRSSLATTEPWPAQGSPWTQSSGSTSRRVCIAQATRRHLRGCPSGLRDCVRWIWQYRGHGRLETERTLGELVDLPVHRVRSRREVSGLLALLADRE